MNTKSHEAEFQNFSQYISNSLDLSNTCRVCMSQNTELYSLSNISQSTGSLNGCIEKIHFCTNVKITENDGLPHTICKACINLLDKAYKFKTICENTDQELRKIISNRNDDIKNEQDSDVTFNNSDVISEKYIVEISNEFRHKSTDNLSVQSVEVLEIEKCNEEFDKEIICTITNKVDKTEQTDAKKKSKLTNCAKAKKKYRKSYDRKNIEEDNSKYEVSQVADIFSNAANGMIEPESEIEMLGLKRSVRKIRKLKCRGCAETFPDKGTRDEHQRTHGDRSYICDICGKGFFCHTTCYTHRKSHFPPKFSCLECPYKTCHKNDLIKHNRIHTGVKLYQCEYCSRSFTFNSNLVKHVKRHKGDRRFKCNLCPKAYFEKVSLSEHLDWHKGIKRHECRICGMAYVDRQHWVRHMEKMHEILVPPTKSGRRKTNIQVTEPYHHSADVETYTIQAFA